MNGPIVHPEITEDQIQAQLGRMDTLRQALAQAIVGQEAVVEQLLIGLLAGGHVLMEGVPGLGKTLLVRSLGQVLDLPFRRVQFTPDLMPGDILGAEILEEDHGTGHRSFRFQPGPVFTSLLLADELNRTPPKTQAALLEAMQERTITIDGKSHPLSERFTVVATQNPLEQQGTYPLPEAQLDRFLFKHELGYPSEAEERAIVASHGARAGQPKLEEFGVEPVADAASIGEAIAAVAQVRLTPDVIAYAVALVRATREVGDFSSGASPRCASMLAIAARARATLDGRDYVIPDDVKALALPALRHRVILSPAAEIDGRKVDDAIRAMIDRVEAPR